MDATAQAHLAELHMRRFRLPAGPTAAATSRDQVLAVIRSWEIPVDPDVAVLLTSELVTNAITHQAGGGAVTLAIRCAHARMRVEVHDTSHAMPVLAPATTDAETGRGLVLIDSLATEWGSYRTPAGKAVYFTLAYLPGQDTMINEGVT